tara:strand:+ start:754 stop:1062 length:309 start_codon:yes stop_codon:yes gene_type:complete
MIGLNQEQKDFVLAEVEVNKEGGEDNPYHVGAGSFFILRSMNDEHKGKGTLIMEDVNDYLVGISSTRTMKISYLTDKEYDLIYDMLEELEFENKISNFNVGG